MKKNTVLFVLLLFFSYSLSGQESTTMKWAKGMGGTGNERGNSITVDALGNVLTTGYFEGTVDFDPGIGFYNLTSIGSNNIFISKLDSSGNFVWAKQFGGTSGSMGNSIAIDASGNVYTTGFFWGTADFDPGAGTYNLTSAGGMDIFISKLDPSGNFVWAKQMGGTSNDESQSIDIDPSGNVYTTGYFQETGDFNPGAGTYNLTSAGSKDIFISKLNSLGNFVWAKQMGGTSIDYGSSIKVGVSGNVYTTGDFSGTADFDPGVGTSNLTSAGSKDIFISKLNSLGNFVWVKQLGEVSIDHGHSIKLDASENVYTSGYFYGTMDFDPGAGTYNLTSTGGRNAYILKLNSFGNFIWAKQLGGTSSEIGYLMTIAVDTSRNVYFTSYFQNTIDFDPGSGTYNLTSAGYYDISILKLDISGSFVWAKKLGGTSNDDGFSIAVDSSGNVYTTGFFQGTANFDPGAGTFNLTSAGSDDIFVHKMSPCTSTSSIITTASCDNYNFNGTDITSSGIYYDTLANIAGCDSIITLNLTIKYSSSSIMYQNACDFYNFNGTNLTNTGIYYDTLVNSVGCDSIITLSLTINNSSTILSETACDNYNFNGTNLTISGVYYDTLTNISGCDSIITLNIIIKNSTTSSITETACDSYTAPDGTVYTTSGIKTAVIQNAVGCDSTITIDLTIKNSTTNSITETACDSYTAPDGTVYTTSGIKTAVIQNAVGCDSTITIDLTIKNSTTNSITETACDSYTAPDGTVYTTSGIKIAVIPNASGCDSTITIDLTINNSTVNSITETACDSYTAPDGNVYTTSGIKTAVIPNASGCDSTITIDLTIENNTAATFTETACDSYTLNAQTYTASGIYTQTLTNAAGCDSTITLNLTINNSTVATLTETACDSYTLNAQTYTASGVYTQTLTNVAGCDSTITLNLTINNSVYAGTDSSDNVYSNYVPTVDLFSYIGTGYNSGGTWLDMDNSGALAGSIFTTNTVPQAVTYHFAYLVQGAAPCPNDSSFVSLFVDICGGISEINTSNIAIYPNPVKNELTIEMEGNNRMLNFEILNAIGQIVFKGYFVEKITIQTSNFAPGVYLVKLENGKIFEFKKIIKE